MKINIADKATGCQKTLDFDDENKVRPFFEKKIGQEVPADSLGEEFKGYTLKITGGADKQGFGMKQGVLTNLRVRLLLDGRTGGLRRPTHDGERKRRTVRGCIVGNDLAVINCVIAKKGPAELPGLTEKTLPRRLGPKRASKIRKLFNLSKEDDVRKFVIRRTSQRKKVTEGKPATRSKAPKIQRLVTSATLHRKHRRTAQKLAALAKSRALKAEYEKLLADRKVEAKEKRAEAVKAKKAAAKAAVAGVAKRQTAVAMKKMKRRANYVLKTKAKIALRQRKPLVGKDARAQAKKAKRAAVLKRRVILKNRKIVLQKCIAARKAVCKDIEAEREQNKKYPSKLCRHRIAKLRAKAHELYLRIMSGGRLANIRQTEKAAARRAARLTKKAAKGQPAAKKAKKAKK